MRRPTEVPEVEHLIAVCLELYERDGPRAVDALLGEHPAASLLVRERLDLLGRMGLVGEPAAEAMPEHIAGYAIVDVLGRGGMGLVYEAQQETPRRRVALKVLRTLPSGELRQRFGHEAELLGRLQHPGIARVYEVGTATVGGMTVPFFAMELVRGRPIDEYADAAGLDLKGRLLLLARVADAVHYAHQQGVVHRDLKPANLLVDERGEPRVLDFGVARAVDQRPTLRTEVGRLVGTLAYMSPEQASGDPREVDRRTDVYSLGVVAYELLARRLPHEIEDRSVFEVLRSIRDEVPARLSDADRCFRGDVETIVTKALAKEKERRYSSADELAADLRRFVRDEPITARPATALYQLAKFSRRHRWFVAAATAFALALALGLVGTVRGMLSAARERDDAERRFRQASAVLAFQKRMFASADPQQRGVQVEDLLDRGVLLLGETEDPVEQAAVRLVLGECYESLGLYGKADPLIAEAAATFERELGAEDLQTLAARTKLAQLYGHSLARLDESAEALAGVVEVATRAHGRDHDVTVTALLARADLMFELGEHAESEQIVRDVLARTETPHQRLWALRRWARALNKLGELESSLEVARDAYAWSLQEFGPDHPATWDSMDTLGNMLKDGGRIPEGLEILEQLFQLREEHLGPSHPDTINAKSNFATSLALRGEPARAKPLLLEVVAACEERFPLRHPERLFTLNNLATVYLMLGQPDRAEPILRDVVEGTIELRGPEHIDSITSMSNLATALGRLGKDDEAEGLFAKCLDVTREARGDRHVETLNVLTMFGQFYTQKGRFAEADPLLREAAEGGREALGLDHYALAPFLLAFGVNLIHQKHFEEAEEALLESLEVAERTRPGHRPSRREAMRALDALYSRWGKPDRAAEYRALLETEPR